jgi:hypothetical protein
MYESRNCFNLKEFDMKKIASLALAAALVFSLSGCADNKVVCGHEYTPYGLFTMDDANPDVHYRPVIGNIVWSIALFETIVAPIYFVGWAIMEPDGPKTSTPGLVADAHGLDCPPLPFLK